MNPGPMDHNGNPARFAWLVRGWCVQPGPVCNSMNPGPMDHNGNQARSGSQLQPGPVCIDRSPSMLNTNHLGRELYSVSTLSLLFL
jgi:hypothetical protein